MFSLPARKGGLGITNLMQAATTQCLTADAATRHLVGALYGKHDWQVAEHLNVFNAARSSRKTEAQEAADTTISSLLAADDSSSPNCLPQATKRAFKRATEHHTSAWLTAAPAVTHGLALTAHEFRDGLALRYGW